MKFADFDTHMRSYEAQYSPKVEEDKYIVVRLDGRGFTRITNDYFEKPFDSHFSRLMVSVAEYVMESDLEILYAYTQSDEISFLLPANTALFARKVVKIATVFSSTASAYATSLTSHYSYPMLTFDGRVAGYTSEQVADYFNWRCADANRNSLNSYAYWMLRDTGLSARAATKRLSHASHTDKVTLLKEEFDFDYETAPAWAVNGVALYWEQYIKNSPETLDPPVLRRHITNTMTRTDFNIVLEEILLKREQVTP